MLVFKFPEGGCFLFLNRLGRVESVPEGDKDTSSSPCSKKPAPKGRESSRGTTLVLACGEHSSQSTNMLSLG